MHPKEVKDEPTSTTSSANTGAVQSLAFLASMAAASVAHAQDNQPTPADPADKAKQVKEADTEFKGYTDGIKISEIHKTRPQYVELARKYLRLEGFEPDENGTAPTELAAKVFVRILESESNPYILAHTMAMIKTVGSQQKEVALLPHVEKHLDTATDLELTIEAIGAYVSLGGKDEKKIYPPLVRILKMPGKPHDEKTDNDKPHIFPAKFFAIQFLGRQREQAANYPGVLDAMEGVIRNDPNERMRFNAAMALSDMNAEGSQTLLKLLTADHEQTVAAGRHGISCLAGKLPQLLETETDAGLKICYQWLQDAHVSSYTVSVLTRWDDTYTNEWFQKMMCILKNDKDPAIRLRALCLTGDVQDEDIVDIVKGFETQPDPLIMSTLQRIGPRATSALANGLKNENIHVRSGSAKTLALIDSDDVDEAKLIASVIKNDEVPYVRFSAISGYTALDDAKKIEWEKKLLDEKDPDDAHFETQEQRNIGALCAILCNKEAEWDMRVAAGKLLESISCHCACEMYGKLSEDSNENEQTQIKFLLFYLRLQEKLDKQKGKKFDPNAPIKENKGGKPDEDGVELIA